MEITLPIYTQQIEKLIPHRYPMLLVDRVIEFGDGQHIVGVKNVTANEQFFQGHFPGRPIMPGVMMLEALAQLGVIFARLCTNGITAEQLFVFSGCEDIRFRRQVIPGDVLRLEMKLIKRKLGTWKMQGLASVDGETAVGGILRATEIPG